jgi:DedD protein
MPMPQNDTEASLNGELELKKRSRRRLVGAIALALLAVIVLPMVMDHEPRQPAQDIQVRIPSQDAGGFSSRILPAKPTATPLPPAEPEAKVEAKPEPKAPESPKPDVKAPEPAKPAAKALEAANAPEKPAPKAVEPSPKQADKSTNKTEEARALAALNGASVSDQWVVQLGAYKDAANVKQLIARLKQMGLPSFTEHFDSPQGARTRVRAGPFKTKDAAEKAREKIKTIGLAGTVAQH